MFFKFFRCLLIFLRSFHHSLTYSFVYLLNCLFAVFPLKHYRQLYSTEFLSNYLCFFTRKIISKLIKKISNIFYCINIVIMSCGFHSYISPKNIYIDNLGIQRGIIYFYLFLFVYIKV